MVSDETLNEWLVKCRSKSRKAETVLLRNAIINYLWLNIKTQQKYIAEFLNFERSTISVVSRQHHVLSKNNYYSNIYKSLDDSNLYNIYLKFISEKK